MLQPKLRPFTTLSYAVQRILMRTFLGLNTIEVEQYRRTKIRASHEQVKQLHVILDDE